MTAINEELRNGLKSAQRKQDRLQKSLEETKQKLKISENPKKSTEPCYKLGQAEKDLGSIIEHLKNKNQNLSKDRKHFKKRSQYYKDKFQNTEKKLNEMRLIIPKQDPNILKKEFRHKVHSEIFEKFRSNIINPELLESLRCLEKYLKTRETRIATLEKDLKKEKKQSGLMDTSNAELVKEVEKVCLQNEELCRNALLLENELRAARDHNEKQNKEKKINEMESEIDLRKAQADLTILKEKNQQIEATIVLREKTEREERRLRSIKETELVGIKKNLKDAQEKIADLAGRLEISHQSLFSLNERLKAKDANLKTLSEQLSVNIKSNIENEKRIERLRQAKKLGKNLEDDDFSKVDYIYYKHQFETLEVSFFSLLFTNFDKIQYYNQNIPPIN